MNVGSIRQRIGNPREYILIVGNLFPGGIKMVYLDSHQDTRLRSAYIESEFKWITDIFVKEFLNVV